MNDGCKNFFGVNVSNFETPRTSPTLARLIGAEGDGMPVFCSRCAAQSLINLVGTHPGLPDGLFSNQKYQFGYILGGLAMENLGVFYDHLVYFTAIGNILWPFGIFCGHLVYFSPFWYFVPRKIWQP
jgi:hypothetical protein